MGRQIVTRMVASNNDGFEQGFRLPRGRIWRNKARIIVEPANLKRIQNEKGQSLSGLCFCFGAPSYDVLIIAQGHY